MKRWFDDLNMPIDVALKIILAALAFGAIVTLG